MTYARARKDFEYLETIAELDNQLTLEEARLELMREPTRHKAMTMYENAIRLWFDEHGSVNAKTEKIRDRHGIR